MPLHRFHTEMKRYRFATVRMQYSLFTIVTVYSVLRSFGLRLTSSRLLAPLRAVRSQQLVGLCAVVEEF